MKKLTTILFIIPSFFVLGQSIDESFSTKKMKKDLEIFKEIRLKANSGLYKYRTKEQIDSVFTWAENEINNLSTYRDFYNLICTITDYEGSLHNETYLPKKVLEEIKREKFGYFPIPVKIIENKLIVNFSAGQIPLGAEIVSINHFKINKLISEFYKYYTTDGINKTGKRIGINKNFGKYFRYICGLQNNFEVEFIPQNSESKKSITLKSVAYSTYIENFKKRHSHSFDKLLYEDPNENEIYTYQQINNNTGLLTLNSFSIGGNEDSKEHKIYKNWLDSIFIKIKNKNITNLIVDVRNNGGGTDPNDVITYSYLTSRKFQESKQVWISFKKIPYLKYFASPIPKILRPLGVGKFNRYFQKRFAIEKNGKYFISKATNEMKVRHPNKNAFKGNIYLLIGPMKIQ